MTDRWSDLPPEIISELATIEPDRPEPFTCVICEKHQENRWPGSVQMWPIEPICRHCESMWGLKAFGSAGVFRDRRIANQIKALSEALNAEAWRAKHKREGYFGSA